MSSRGGISKGFDAQVASSLNELVTGERDGGAPRHDQVGGRRREVSAPEAYTGVEQRAPSAGRGPTGTVLHLLSVLRKEDANVWHSVVPGAERVLCVWSWRRL